MNFNRQIRMSYQMKKTNNKQKKKETKWNRLIQNWGHSNSALDELYNEGDQIHGQGFRAYLDNIIVHRDEPKHISNIPTGRYDLLNTDSPKTQKKMSFIDIQKEQLLGLA